MKIKPYIPLDREVLNLIEKFYKVRDVDELLNRFCFSNPQLESHQCNNLALTKGEVCEHCNNVPEKFNCQITCDISHVCHAAYACRLGIGGKDIVKAVKNNSELQYDQLLEEIKNCSIDNKKKEEIKVGEIENSILVEVLPLEQPVLKETVVGSEIIVKPGEETMSEIEVVTEETEKDKVGRPAVDPSEELFTCKQVADILGCTLMNIYQKIANKKINYVGNPRKRRIPASEVERLKKESRTFKKRQALEATPE
jgi:excisionase family DNA binding protein